MSKVPELSLHAYTHGLPREKSAFIDALFAGLRQYGFVILKDHPVDVSLLRQAYALSEKLFALPDHTKRAYVSPAGGGVRGYTPFGTEHAKNSKLPDLKEFWHVGRELPRGHRLESFFAPNIWPAELPEFRPVFERLYSALDNSGRLMLEALTVPLEVDRDYFTRMTDLGSSVLRLLHYPPIPPGVEPGAVRAAAHEDINLITFLVSASSSGLELLTRQGEWLKVETSPENIIVDSGDMLARITNEVLPATTHRVVNPAGPNVSRYSMPFFMHPNPDARLECLPSCRGDGEKYPPILANDFLLERLRAIGLTK
ncbi:MAG TPA: 2-oxoglutarate and iron-dependent oxygenase domain-containing protein [Bdellovibrionales bacterium]|mgnify:CR=1 FL=1|nr:2-oxoglutarate and iron-dependent oxygenase domain-containing protein [Bdellovibrionales bacterium]